MTNGEKFIEVFGDTTVLFDTDDNDTTIHQSGNWWDEEYKQSNSDSDCISRKAVLNLVKELRFDSVEGMKDYCYRCIDPHDVEDLPSIQPKKVGKWQVTHKIYDQDVICYKCSECGSPFPYKTMYCANCGNKMEKNRW